MELNASERVLTFKVVYYGPALGGKTTNLLTIHALTDKEKRSELISISTRDDRTLFFDLLPMGIGRFFGLELKLKLYTVPGQVQFDVTRRRVLAGADAVVFVADSQKSQAAANALSLRNLRINMIQNKLDPKTTPITLQYNKRDLPEIQSIQEMDAALNEELRVASFGAVATTGAGVIECLASAVSRAVEGAAVGRGLAQTPDARRAAASIRDTLMAFAVKGSERDAAGAGSMPAALGGSVIGSTSPRGAQGPVGAGGGGRGGGTIAGGKTSVTGGAEASGTWTHRAESKLTDEVDLLDEAVKANLALSDRLSALHGQGSLAARREHQVRALGLLARLAEESGDPQKIEIELLTQSLQALGLDRGSFLAKPPAGPLAVRFLAGHRTDPLVAIASPPLSCLAERLIAGGRVVLSNDVVTEILFGEAHAAAAGLMSLLFSPVRLIDGAFGGLFLYGSDAGHTFDANDELFIEAACRIASLARLRIHAPAAVR